MNLLEVLFGQSGSCKKGALGMAGWFTPTDSLGKPLWQLPARGLGASVWWPNKDHQADEVDSMLISISVPTGLTRCIKRTLSVKQLI